jgi:hypothetical protein
MQKSGAVLDAGSGTPRCGRQQECGAPGAGARLHAIAITTFMRRGSVIGPSVLKQPRAVRKELVRTRRPSSPCVAGLSRRFGGCFSSEDSRTPALNHNYGAGGAFKVLDGV